MVKISVVALAFVLGAPVAAFASDAPTPLVEQADASPAPASSSPIAVAVPAALASPAMAAAPAASATPDPGPTRRAYDPPMDPIFPSADFLGPTIGVPNDTTVFPLQKALFPKSNGNGIRVYGWADIGALASTSKNSTYPQTYNIDPNMVNLDQLILRFEKQPDTTQTAHGDWGFRLSSLFGIDYRWTAAEGYVSGQLLQHNQLYGYDPVEAYGILYLPRLGQGTVVDIGRFISPPDIEAQLAPNNYLYSHSIFFDFDAYTQTGVLFSTKLSNQWTIQYGVHSGNDTAPWDASQHFPTGELIARYVAPSNRNSLLFGIDAINGNGQFRTYTLKGQLAGHDNIQQENFTWTHIFNSRLHNAVETYFLYEFNAYVGGTINNGPAKFGGGGGAGAYLPGRSDATGAVDYLEYKFDNTDFASFRTDYMNDNRGFRSGFASAYGSLTLGVTHKFTNNALLRPELRFEKALTAGVLPYDNGTRHSQVSFGMDLIENF